MNEKREDNLIFEAWLVKPEYEARNPAEHIVMDLEVMVRDKDEKKLNTPQFKEDVTKWLLETLDSLNDILDQESHVDTVDIGYGVESFRKDHRLNEQQAEMLIEIINDIERYYKLRNSPNDGS